MRRNKKLPVIRQALLMSLISMFVCVVMLVGMTYAWFTDSASASVNLIRSGNINITAEYLVKNTNEWCSVQTTSSKELFIPQDNNNNNNSWAPGSTASAYFKIKNIGDIPARCGFSVKFAKSDAASTLFTYTIEQIKTDENDLPVTQDDAAAAPATENMTSTVSLKSKESVVIKVTVSIPRDVSIATYNAAQPTSTTLSLNVLAVQDSITKGSEAETKAFAEAEGNMSKSSAEGGSESTDPSGSKSK